MSNEDVERTVQLFHALAMNENTTFPSSFHGLSAAIRPFLMEVYNALYLAAHACTAV